MVVTDTPHADSLRVGNAQPSRENSVVLGAFSTVVSLALTDPFGLRGPV